MWQYGHGLAVRNVGELQSSAQAQHAIDLRKGRPLVGAKVHHSVAGDDIRPAVLDGQILREAVSELEVAEAQPLRCQPRFCEHLLRQRRQLCLSVQLGSLRRMNRTLHPTRFDDVLAHSKGVKREIGFGVPSEILVARRSFYTISASE